MTAQRKKIRPGKNDSMPPQRKFQLAVLLGALFAFGVFLNSCMSPINDKSQNRQSNVEPVTQQTPEPTPNFVKIESADFSKFGHFSPAHAELSCLMCHRAEENRQATPKLPGHTPCAGCHADQFQDKTSLICTICHTEAETGKLKSFPPLKNFNAAFNHSKHLRQTNCATCHQPSRGGVAVSIPAGFAAHSNCFQCHAPGSPLGGNQDNPNSCATCHQQGSPPRAVSESAKAFSVGFSHAEHRGMNCTSCHAVRAGSQRGNQVTSIVAAMHFPPRGAQSCASCHNNQRAFGGTDFADCKRCHTGNNFGF